MTDEDLQARFAEVGADWAYSKQLLDRLNKGELTAPRVVVDSFPPLDGQQILDLRGDGPWTVSRTAAVAALKRFFPEGVPPTVLPGKGGDFVTLDGPTLDALGLRLSQYTAFGVLNGGMATSYVDSKKNQAFGAGLYAIFKSDLERMAELTARGLPAVLVPLEGLADNHQVYNADWMAIPGAAEVIADKELTAVSLAAVLGDLLGTPGKLAKMADDRYGIRLRYHHGRVAVVSVLHVRRANRAPGTLYVQHEAVGIGGYAVHPGL